MNFKKINQGLKLWQILLAARYVSKQGYQKLIRRITMSRITNRQVSILTRLVCSLTSVSRCMCLIFSVQTLRAVSFAHTNNKIIFYGIYFISKFPQPLNGTIDSLNKNLAVPCWFHGLALKTWRFSFVVLRINIFLLQ